MTNLLLHTLFFYQVRLYTLKIAEAMYSKLGEEFTVLLPETIPFLAELVEGNDRCGLLSYTIYDHR